MASVRELEIREWINQWDAYEAYHETDLELRRFLSVRLPDSSGMLAYHEWGDVRYTASTDSLLLETIRYSHGLWRQFASDPVLGPVLGPPPPQDPAARDAEVVRSLRLAKLRVALEQPNRSKSQRVLNGPIAPHPADMRAVEEIDRRAFELRVESDRAFQELVAERFNHEVAAMLGLPDGTLRCRVATDASWAQYLCNDIVICRFAVATPSTAILIGSYDANGRRFVDLCDVVRKLDLPEGHLPPRRPASAVPTACYVTEEDKKRNARLLERHRKTANASSRDSEQTRQSQHSVKSGSRQLMRPGEVWFARPSRSRSDGSGPAEHPVVVLADSGDAHDVWCCDFTSQARRTDDPRYLEFRGGWVAELEREASYANVADAPETVTRSTFRRKVGVLGDTEWARLVNALDGRYEKLIAQLDSATVELRHPRR